MRRKRGDAQVSAAVGQVLERIRAEQRLSLRVVQRAVGLAAHHSVQGHESGVVPITLDYFVKYCEAYGVDPVYVLAQALSEQAARGDQGE